MKMLAQLLTLTAAAIGTAAGFAQSPDELAKSVTIRRTEYGVPHIRANNELAAGFGIGYAQAEDHCSTIMKLMIAARGDLAATFGDVGDNVNSDFRYRQYRVHKRARETFNQLDADWRAMLQGYAMGFNYYVDQHRRSLPNWVGHISGQDVAAHGLAGVARFAFNRGGIVGDFLGSVRSHTEDMGSNMWSFDGTRTTSGKTILMGNPHQPWSDVATYYEMHVTIPGKYNFYGGTFIGRPVMTTGFNAHLGWSHTVNYPDLEEIYAFDIDPTNSERYLLDGERIQIEREEVAISVLSGSDFQTRTRAFHYTPHGPVIYRDADRIYVLRSAAYDEFRFYQQWYRLGQAESFREFKRALEIMAIPMFNIGYADDQGNIYYLWNGTVPQMPHAAQDATAVHATRRSQVWSRFVPLDELPQLLNPRGGYIMNSNSAPYFTNLHEPMNRASFPAYFPDNNLSLRSQHSLSLIHNDKRFSLEDVADMKFSLKALVADRVLDDLLELLRGTITFTEAPGEAQNRKREAEAEHEREKQEREREKEQEKAEREEEREQERDDKVGRAFEILDVIERVVRGEESEQERPAEEEREEEPISPESPATPHTPTTTASDPELAQAINLLADWDRTVSARSKGSALFQEWWTEYVGDWSIYTDQGHIFAEVWDESRPMETPRGIAKPERAIAAFKTAMRDMKRRFGGWDIRWGQNHRMRTGNKDLKIGGGGHDLGCFRIVLYEKGDDGKYVANSGDSWVFAVEFGDTPRAYTLVAYSQSGDPDSLHFNDQAELYAELRMKPAAFTEADIREQLLIEYTPASR